MVSIMKKIVICDIDGTIANNDHRQHYLEGKKDWDGFFSEIINDSPIMPVIKIINEEFGRGLAFLNRHNRDMNLSIPKRLIEQLMWFRRWTNSFDTQDMGRNDLLVCKTFQIRRGRIYLYMRQEMKWKTRRIPANLGECRQNSVKLNHGGPKRLVLKNK